VAEFNRNSTQLSLNKWKILEMGSELENEI